MGIEFDVAAIEKEMYPVVIAFTSTKVRSFDGNINVSTGMSTCVFVNPSIHETEEFKRRYVGPQYAPKILAGVPKRMQRPPIDISTVEIMTIKSLNNNQSTASANKQQTQDKESFFIKGEITRIMCQEDWYYMGCPKCLKQMRVLDSTDTLKCVKHLDATALPMYKLQIRIEDKTDSATVMVIGKAGDSLFGISCENAFNEAQQLEENSSPPALMKLKGQTRIIEIVYGRRNDFVLKSVHHESDQVSAEPSTVRTPQKQTAKRNFSNQSEMNAKDFSKQETTKKHKGQDSQLMQFKNKQIEQEHENAEGETPDQELVEEPQSEEDGDFTLSQLFNQHLFNKKNSGQTAKPLVIGKKASDQANKSAVVEKKMSERIRSKNKGKME